MKQNYIDWVDWEKIDHEEYRTKISACTKKLDGRQEKLFFEILIFTSY